MTVDNSSCCDFNLYSYYLYSKEYLLQKHDRKNHASKSKGEKPAEVFPIMQEESMYLCDA